MSDTSLLNIGESKLETGEEKEKLVKLEVKDEYCNNITVAKNPEDCPLGESEFKQENNPTLYFDVNQILKVEHENHDGDNYVDEKPESWKEPKQKVNIAWNKQDVVVIEGTKIERNAEGLFSCSSCSKVFKTPADIKRHVVVHTKQKNHQCNICMKSFGYKYVLERHLHTHNPADIHCPKCDKKFSHQSNLEIHLKRIHEQAGIFVCSFCSQTFNQRSYLLSHERKHTGEKPYQCEHCLDSFPEKRTLYNHYYKDHNLPKPHVCEICGKTFVLNSDLINHMYIHSEEKKFKCEECGASFHQKRVLGEHKLKHKVKRGTYTGASTVCCGKVFTSKQRLKLHVQVVHENQKPFECEECKKLFARQDTLRQHKLIHEGKFDLQCEICSKQFRGRSRILQNHMKRHHGVFKDDISHTDAGHGMIDQKNNIEVLADTGSESLILATPTTTLFPKSEAKINNGGLLELDL
eukprot:GFUD01032084.1.p1 GENE.GFUD01032084.1~~GFUD01032084.1.p1  ORF type:complete len:464 (-),score=93.06 GFUD01032084.1:57-1448(-)